MTERRALHFVFKIGDRQKTIQFYEDILGMKVLRHEEFDEKCQAACNGPYDGKWSKTMIGYGPEDDHFVIELTYNYGISTYRRGNDFGHITIRSKEILENARKQNWPIEDGNKVRAPDGYLFVIIDESRPTDEDPVKVVSLNVSNIQRSRDYWHRLCGLQIFSENDNKILLGFEDNKCKLELVLAKEPINHATAFGRIAFAIPTFDLPKLEQSMKDAGEKILTSLLTLQTPGKADVQVVILSDPDGHEICFVGVEGFNELSQFDPDGNRKLKEAMEADKSNQWFSEKGINKAAA